MKRIKVKGHRVRVGANKSIKKPATIGGKISHLVVEENEPTNLDRLKDSLKNLNISAYPKKAGRPKKYVVL